MTSTVQLSLRNLSGKFSQSRQLSGDVASVMKIQGFNTITRSAAARAPVHLDVSQAEGVIKIKQSTTSWLPSIMEEWYPEDNEWREKKDGFMGQVRSRSRWCKVSELGEHTSLDFLRKDLGEEEEVIEAVVEGLGSTYWKATQVWCCEGENFVRRVVTEGKDGSKAEIRLVYVPA